MTPRPRAVIIISLKAVHDGEAIEKRASSLPGVINAEVNHFTRKLVVHYDDEVADLAKIKSEIEKILKGEGKAAGDPSKKR